MATTLHTTELPGPSIDLRSIAAGAVAAAALSMVLLAFGGALGLSMTSARPYAGLSSTTVGIISALWLALVYILTFAAGGYVAGRLRVPISASAKEREFRDGAHGFLVWALGTLVGAYLIASTLTAVTSKTVDAAAGIAEAAGQATTAAVVDGGIAELLSYNVEKMLRPGASTNASNPQQAIPSGELADLARIFAVSVANGSLAAGDKDYLAAVVSERAGLPIADATIRVDEAYAAVVATKVAVEEKARSAAETARKVGILTAFLAAALALAGLVAAVWAASSGGQHRDEGRDLELFGQKRLW